MRDTIIQPRTVSLTAQQIGQRVQAEDRTRKRAESDAMQFERDKRTLFELCERRGLLTIKAWLGEAQRYAESLTVDGRR